MKKILFVGEHPRSGLGNGNMFAAILGQLDRERWQFACLVVTDIDPLPYMFKPLPFTMVNLSNPWDLWGDQKILSMIERLDFDVLFMVGFDIWRYNDIRKKISQLRDKKKFKWIWLFPYDLQMIRLDWVRWINDLDFPCVYSLYGKEMLKDVVPNIEYFRPPMFCSDVFHKFEGKKRIAARKETFATAGDKLVGGFVGKNQIRKSPERLIKGFLMAKRSFPEMELYLHTDMQDAFNLLQVIKDYGGKDGDFVAKRQGRKYTPEQMAQIYNSLDFYINPSMQEGLSWTVIEAMACGVPVIASATTAHNEIVSDVGTMIPCRDDSFIAVITESGESQIETKACRAEDIRNAILTVARNPELRDEMSRKGVMRAKEWLDGVSDVNELLERAVKPAIVPKRIDKVLFAQWGSAGDVLMTTQCFRGIKERHKGKPLVYMTQGMYHDVVRGNPYIEQIIDWDPKELKKVAIVYNPHGEKILPGGWNNLDVPLHSMYPYFCKVDSDIQIIDQVDPEMSLPDEYVVIHTSGGSPYRRYPHMAMVVKDCQYPIIQVGGSSDVLCKSALDLRGKLTWRESAWVVANAKAAVVVDSFMSHLCGAVGTNCVVLYGPAPARVVGPRMQHGAKRIDIQPDMLAVCKILSHCWGTNPSCVSPCINTIHPMKVRDALNTLLEDLDEGINRSSPNASDRAQLEAVG